MNSLLSLLIIIVIIIIALLLINNTRKVGGAVATYAELLNYLNSGQYDVLKGALEPGNVNEKNVQGESLLMTAAKNLDIKASEILLSKGVNASLRDNNGETALGYLAKKDLSDADEIKASIILQLISLYQQPGIKPSVPGILPPPIIVPGTLPPPPPPIITSDKPADSDLEAHSDPNLRFIINSEDVYDPNGNEVWYVTEGKWMPYSEYKTKTPTPRTPQPPPPTTQQPPPPPPQQQPPPPPQQPPPVQETQEEDYLAGLW